MKLDIKSPDTIEELVDLLNYNDNIHLITGGTDFVIKMKEEKIYSGTIIDLSNIKETQYIKEDKESILIGSGVTLSDICDSELVKQYAPALRSACSQVGSTLIRNRATIAGNVANASPVADTIPPLMVVDAKIKTIDNKGATKLWNLNDIIERKNKTALSNKEVIIEIIIKKQTDYIGSFAKVGSRKYVTISKLNSCLVVKYNKEKNIIEDAKIALGSLGEKCFISEIASDILINRRVDYSLLNDFQNVLTNQVDLSIKGRASCKYKREAVKGVGYDLLYQLFNDKILGGENSCRTLSISENQ